MACRMLGMLSGIQPVDPKPTGTVGSRAVDRQVACKWLLVVRLLVEAWPQHCLDLALGELLGLLGLVLLWQDGFRRLVSHGGLRWLLAGGLLLDGVFGRLGLLLVLHGGRLQGRDKILSKAKHKWKPYTGLGGHPGLQLAEEVGWPSLGG